MIMIVSYRDALSLRMGRQRPVCWLFRVVHCIIKINDNWTIGEKETKMKQIG